MFLGVQMTHAPKLCLLSQDTCIRNNFSKIKKKSSHPKKGGRLRFMLYVVPHSYLKMTVMHIFYLLIEEEENDFPFPRHKWAVERVRNVLNQPTSSGH